MKNIFLLLGLSLLLAGCESSTKEPLPNQPNYFPQAVDRYIIYSYIEINHDPLQETSDTSYSLLREYTEAKITNAAEDTNYKVIVEQSFNEGKSWKYVKNVLHYATAESAFRIEDDLRKSKLVFPLRDFKTWDANHQNNLETQRARMIDIGEPLELGDTTYANTVTVDLGEDIDPFFQNKELEIYAENIGLVYREYQDLETQPDKYINGIEIIKTIQKTNWTP